MSQVWSEYALVCRAQQSRNRKGETFKEATVTQLLPRVGRQRSIAAPHFESDKDLVTRFTAKKQRTGESINFTVQKASQRHLHQGRKPASHAMHLTTAHDRQHCFSCPFPLRASSNRIFSHGVFPTSLLTKLMLHKHRTLLETLRVVFTVWGWTSHSEMLSLTLGLGLLYFDAGSHHVSQAGLEPSLPAWAS